MDDIYDNLDNYEDLHILEELKKENQELKIKLENYTVTMAKLQKDFDRLSADFKNMERNYSSLMKTARVEVERKTKIINDLNVEKDMIVLKALQNSNNFRSLRDITKPFQKGPMNHVSMDKAKSTTSSPADNLKAKTDIGRKEESRFSSVDTVTSSNTDIGGRLLKLACNNTESGEVWSDRTSDTKENMLKKVVGDVNMNRPLSIRNRRKSMPAARPAKSSSDEGSEDDYCRNKNETYKKDYKRQTTKEENRQNLDRVYNERYRHKAQEERTKAFETSSIDDRFSGFNPGRDTWHRGRIDRFGTDKYRERDRCENSQRNRRHLSPKRPYRPQRSEDHYQRQDYGRHRVLESPPPETFNHQQRNREIQSNSKHDYHNYERRTRQQENDTLKHKIVTDLYDEPISKRQRTDSLSKYSEEERRWSGEKVPLEKTVSDLMAEMPEYTSCQSPDYSVSDMIPLHPAPRVIRLTASTPIDDPRIKSKKYILKKTDNNAIWSTVAGRNVNLQMVDASKWDVKNTEKKLDVPKALKRRPSQCSDDITKDIYMDIENPVSNMSTESGEILSFVEDERGLKDYNKTSQPCPDTEAYYQEAEAICIDKPQDKIIAKDSSERSTYKILKKKNYNEEKSFQGSVASTVHSKTFLNKNEPLNRDLNEDYQKSEKQEFPNVLHKDYKTTKNQEKWDVDKVFERNRQDLPNVLQKDNNTTKKQEKLDEGKVFESERKDSPNMNKVGKNQKSYNEEGPRPEREARSDNKNKDHSSHKRDEKFKVSVAVAKQIVAGDLELSDETSDNMDIEKKTVIKKTTTSKKVDCEVKNSLNKNDEIAVKDVSDIKSDITCSGSKLLPETKPVEIESKKQRGRKKISKVKEAVLKEPDRVSDKKPRLKRDKKDTKEIETKFTELFGDSSSLITPEDLGIPAVQAQHSSAKYVPICEDAQDAVDLKVTDAAKVAACLPQLAEPVMEKTSKDAEICVEAPECEVKTKPKPTNETKRKKSPKTDSESATEVEKARVSEVGIKLLSSESVIADPVLISPIEEQAPVLDKNKTDKNQLQIVECLSIPITQNNLHIPLVSVQALATSTPHKGFHQGSPEASSVTVVERSRTASFADSADRTGDQSSSGVQGVPGPQTEADAPDVRIFVKRRRRVIKKT